MECPYCKKEAEWVENKMIYGRNYGKSYMCWLCKPCDAYVGCHNNTQKALGTMADKETRKYRKMVHDKTDPLWISGKTSRKQLYNKISLIIGKEFHAGSCSIEDCKKILSLSLV